MTWKTSLRFPSRPKISREAQNLIESLICEKGDRLGSGFSLGPSSRILNSEGTRLVDRGMAHGAEEIKAHPFFKSINFDTIHLQTPPFVPDLQCPSDTRYFEDDIDPNPLAAPDAALHAADATKDPMLKGAHGATNLDVRKQLAFQVCYIPLHFAEKG